MLGGGLAECGNFGIEVGQEFGHGDLDQLGVFEVVGAMQFDRVTKNHGDYRAVTDTNLWPFAARPCQAAAVEGLDDELDIGKAYPAIDNRHLIIGVRSEDASWATDGSNKRTKTYSLTHTLQLIL